MYYLKRIFFIRENSISKFFFIISFIIVNKLYSQIQIENKNNFEYPRLIANTSKYYQLIFNNSPRDSINKKLSASYNTHYIYNTGHSNIDNNGRFNAIGKNNFLHSFRISINLRYLFIELEPYEIQNKNAFDKLTITNSYRFLNNHSPLRESVSRGLKNSQAILHFKGLGLGFGYVNQWWGPGAHSSLVLTSNSRDIKTFSLGTFESFKYKNISFYYKIIASQFKASTANYKTANDPYDIFVTGMRSYLKFHSKPEITIGFNRLYLSNNYPGYLSNTRLTEWNLDDAIGLLWQPIFGQSVRNEDQVAVGSPGFDPWDQSISGFINAYFEEDNLDLFIEIASDDKRANLTDFLAHWDHTLGYLLGFNKYYVLQKNLFFIRAEYLNTLPSNTTNPKFYRGNPNLDNFYNSSIYDYSTYAGRRMGAHSGSSSDDFVLYLGLKWYNNLLIFSYNHERHGVKSTSYPEIKRELALTLSKEFFHRYNVFFRIENEEINNFGFMNENKSNSKLIWIGFSSNILK